MAKRNQTKAAAAAADNQTMDFNDPETGNEHDDGGEVQDPEAEPEAHDDKHEDDGKPEPEEGANKQATDEVLDGARDGIVGAEPEKEYDHEAAQQDTDNTHQDGNNGLHQEDYIDADTAAELGKQEASEYRQTEGDTELHPGDIGRRINLSNEGLVHSTLAPANRDETIVGEHPEREKGLRPVGPLDGVNRSDDAGRPYDGDRLHTAEKGVPMGQGVIEHLPAPTATGSVPEGIMSARAPVPVSGYQRDPSRYDERQKIARQSFLNEAHHAALDSAEDLRVKNAPTFLASQVGASALTCDALVDAGLLTSQEAMGGGNFPNSGKVYKLTY